MPAKLHIVTLTADERKGLEAVVQVGRRSARTVTRARVLLLTDQGEHGPGWEDRRVADRKIGSLARLKREVATWDDDQNERIVGVSWRFTAADARVKLKRLYPTIELQ